MQVLLVVEVAGAAWPALGAGAAWRGVVVLHAPQSARAAAARTAGAAGLMTGGPFRFQAIRLMRVTVPQMGSALIPVASLSAETIWLSPV